MVTIVAAKSPEQLDAVRALIREYTDWAFALAPGSENAPSFHGLDEELASLPGIFGPPAGRLLLATVNGVPAGCIALRSIDYWTAELKRLYVRSDFRGFNIGRKLVGALTADARAIGYRRVILDSHISMTAAHAIYEAAGFRRVSAPDGFPDALVPRVVFMELTLDPWPVDFATDPRVPIDSDSAPMQPAREEPIDLSAR